MKEPDESSKTNSVNEKLSSPIAPKTKRDQVQSMIEAIEFRRRFIKPQSFRKHSK